MVTGLMRLPGSLTKKLHRILGDLSGPEAAVVFPWMADLKVPYVGPGALWKTLETAGALALNVYLRGPRKYLTLLHKGMAFSCGI